MALVAPPPIAWVKQFTQTNTDTAELDPTVAVDSRGNVYVTHSTDGTTSGGTNSGSTDIVIYKVDTTGSLLWVKQQPTFNTEESDFAPTIVIDSSDNLYICYSSSGTVPGGTNLGSADIVVMKLDTDGNIQWIKEQAAHNTVGFDYAPEIAVDGAGNSYVAYRTNSSVAGQTDTGGDDVVVFKLNANGIFQWVRQQNTFNTTQDDNSPRIAVDASGNSYVVYFTQGTVSGQTKTSGPSEPDIVIFKHDTDGNLVWVQQNATFNTVDSNSVPSVSVGRDGNVYVVYATVGTTPGGTNLGSNDVVVMKMDPAGTILWTRQQASFNTTGSDTFPDVVVDTAGNSYITYNTNGTVSGQTSAGGNTDVVVFSLDNTGAFRWVLQNPRFNTNTGFSYRPRIALDARGNVYVVYYTGGAIPGGVASGSYDVVVFKLGGSYFPGMVNPYITLDTTLIYTRETVDTLVAGGSGATLPAITRVSWAPLGVASLSLLRKLGKMYTVPVSAKNRLAAYKFGSVQLVAGLGSEGVGGSPLDVDPWQTGYVCAWSADGIPPTF